jgi:uncharacterized membrane protein
MFGPNSRAPAALALFASALGLVFASYSTFDYAKHLDRRLHDVHCSFIPGLPATAEAEACRAAMYSPYSALLREQYWGGIPISLFALGAFTFFVGFSLYLMIAAGGAPRRAVVFFAVLSVTPLLVSLLMLGISVTQLGELCNTCVGIYVSSFLLALGGLLNLLTLREPRVAPYPPALAGYDPRRDAVPAVSARPQVSGLLPLAWLTALALVTIVPSLVYASTVPDHRPYLTKCGVIKQPDEKNDALIKIRSNRSVQSAMFFEDPLCPTCKGFHERLVQEDIFDKLNVQLVLFPLDSACNWMLDRPLHPGACTVSKAVICGGERAREILEWAYSDQEYLTRAGKAGEPTLRAVIQERWGPDMIRCIDDRMTEVRLNRHLHFSSDNSIPVSTPQVYLGKQRICDEDTDIGLRFTLGQLAPELLR